MARQPQVTRTIPTTKAKVLVVDIDSGITSEREVCVPRVHKNPKKLREALEIAVNKGNDRLAHIKSTEIVEVLYGMSEQKFIENAEILPPRGTKEETEETDDTVNE